MDELLKEITKIIKREFMLISPADMAKLILAKAEPLIRKQMKDECNKLLADCITLQKAKREQAKKDERKRIIDRLQDLIESSKKVKEPAINVKMMAILQALKGETK